MASAWGKAWGKAWGDAWGLLDVPYRTLDFKSQIFVQQILAHTYTQHQVESIVAHAERHNLSVLSAASSLYSHVVARQSETFLTRKPKVQQQSDSAEPRVVEKPQKGVLKEVFAVRETETLVRVFYTPEEITSLSRSVGTWRYDKLTLLKMVN